MSSTYLTDGIVLKRQDWREYDRLITLYTEEYGKVETVARGVRKIVSKLAGHLEPLTYARFMLARGRTFDVVASSVRQSSFIIAQKDLAAFALSSYFFDAVDRLTRPSLADRALFRILVAFLEMMEQEVSAHDGSPVFQRLLLTEFFLLRILHQLGYLPALEQCVVGHEPIGKDGCWFSYQHSGLVCSAHKGDDPSAQAVAAQATEILRLMSDGELEAVRLAKRDDRSVSDCAVLLNGFCAYLVGMPLRSEQYFLSVAAMPRLG